MKMIDEGKWQVYVSDIGGSRYYTFNISVADTLFQRYGVEVFSAAMQQAAERIAAQYVKDYGPEIMAQMDQKAVALSAVAQAGHEVARSLVSRSSSRSSSF